MARFIVVRHTAINQEHIIAVDFDEVGRSVTLRLSNGTTMDVDGFSADAVMFWLKDHVRKMGSDTEAMYADEMADRAMGSVDDL